MLRAAQFLLITHPPGSSDRRPLRLNRCSFLSEAMTRSECITPQPLSTAPSTADNDRYIAIFQTLVGLLNTFTIASNSLKRPACNDSSAAPNLCPPHTEVRSAPNYKAPVIRFQLHQSLYSNPRAHRRWHAFGFKRNNRHIFMTSCCP
jgi:hypothetical protein